MLQPTSDSETSIGAIMGVYYLSKEHQKACEYRTLELWNFEKYLRETLQINHVEASWATTIALENMPNIFEQNPDLKQQLLQLLFDFLINRNLELRCDAAEIN
jgi:hypothetical protein